MHIYCPFIRPVAAPPVAYWRQSGRSAAGRRMVFQDWTGIDVRRFNGKGWWVLWLCLTLFTTSQKCCCPGINGLKRMRMVVEEAAISHKGTEEPFQTCVDSLVHSAQARGAKPIDDHAHGWQWLMSRNSQSMLFYLKHHKGALSANICNMSGLNESQTHEDTWVVVMPRCMYLVFCYPAIMLYVSEVIKLISNWIMSSQKGWGCIYFVYTKSGLH